jgi:hypothetical protein
MNERSARKILTCHLEQPFVDPPPQVERALKAISNSKALEEDYKKQLQLDKQALDALEGVQVPDEVVAIFATKIESAASKSTGVRNPAMISVGIGFVLLVALLVWNFLGRPAAFPPDALEVAESALKFDGATFEDAGIPAGELADWFVLRGFEGFFVPKGLEDMQADSAAIVKIKNQPAAIVDAGEGSARFVVFGSDALGVAIPPGEWRTADIGGGSAGAIRQQDEMCFMVLIKGSAADASDFARRGAR